MSLSQAPSTKVSGSRTGARACSEPKGTFSLIPIRCGLFIDICRPEFENSPQKLHHNIVIVLINLLVSASGWHPRVTATVSLLTYDLPYLYLCRTIYRAVAGSRPFWVSRVPHHDRGSSPSAPPPDLSRLSARLPHTLR